VARPRSRPGRPGFYPRLREGGDIVSESFLTPVSSFYPRLREGGDYIVKPGCIYEVHVSTHASAREATLPVQRSYSGADVSTHASAREATSSGNERIGSGNGFYPRLREGGDLI